MKGGTKKLKLKKKGKGPRSHLARSAQTREVNMKDQVEVLIRPGVSKKKRRLPKLKIPGFNVKKSKESKSDMYAMINNECTVLKKVIKRLYHEIDGSITKLNKLPNNDTDDKKEIQEKIRGKIEKFKTFKDDLDMLNKVYKYHFERLFSALPIEIQQANAPEYEELYENDKDFNALLSGFSRFTA